MTTIRIETMKNEVNDIVCIDVVDLDGEKYFHLHGYIDGNRVNDRIDVGNSMFSFTELSYLTDHYSGIINSK